MGVVKNDYVSEHTRWINEQMAQHPEWAEGQREGRALWWDQKQEARTVASLESTQVPHKAYPYDVNF